MARHERWTAIVSAGLIFGALLACKKKGSEATSEASASAAVVTPPPPAPTQTAVPTESVKLGDVKRYADKEKKSDEAAVRVLTQDIKVFNEADSKTPEVATLPKDALVFRLAEVDGFQLVEFPSGVGQFSQGWVEKAGLSDKPEKVARDVVLKDEKKVATVKTDGGVKAVASGSAKDGGAADAAADAAASASAKPLTDAEKLKAAEQRAADAEKAAAEEKERRRLAEKRARDLRRAAQDAGKK
jgi:hypothetical protein